jgi:hypothetical protein
MLNPAYRNSCLILNSIVDTTAVNSFSALRTVSILTQRVSDAALVVVRSLSNTTTLQGEIAQNLGMGALASISVYAIIHRQLGRSLDEFIVLPICCSIFISSLIVLPMYLIVHLFRNRCRLNDQAKAASKEMETEALECLRSKPSFDGVSKMTRALALAEDQAHLIKKSTFFNAVYQALINGGAREKDARQAADTFLKYVSNTCRDDHQKTRLIAFFAAVYLARAGAGPTAARIHAESFLSTGGAIEQARIAAKSIMTISLERKAVAIDDSAGLATHHHRVTDLAKKSVQGRTKAQHALNPANRGGRVPNAEFKATVASQLNTLQSRVYIFARTCLEAQTAIEFEEKIVSLLKTVQTYDGYYLKCIKLVCGLYNPNIQKEIVDRRDKIVGFVDALCSHKDELAVSLAKLAALQAFIEVIASIQFSIKIDSTLVISKALNEASTKAATAAISALVSIERINRLSPGPEKVAAIDSLGKEVLVGQACVIVSSQLASFIFIAENQLLAPLFYIYHNLVSHAGIYFFHRYRAYGQTDDNASTLSTKRAKKLLAPARKAIDAVTKQIRVPIDSIKSNLNQWYVQGLHSNSPNLSNLYKIVVGLTSNFYPGRFPGIFLASAFAQKVLADLEPQVKARRELVTFAEQFTVVLLKSMIRDYKKLHGRIVQLALVAAPAFKIPDDQALTVAKLFANKVLAPAYKIIHSVNQAIAIPFFKMRGEFERKYSESRLTDSPDDASQAGSELVNQLVPSHIVEDLLKPTDSLVRLTGDSPDANFSFDCDEEYFQVVAATLDNLDRKSTFEAEAATRANREIISDLYHARNLALRSRSAFDSFCRPLFQMFDEHELGSQLHQVLK